MEAQISSSELHAFYHFLEACLENGGETLSPEESVQAFRRHQQEFSKIKKMLADAEQSSARGESKSLDIDALKERVRTRLAERGITE